MNRQQVQTALWILAGAALVLAGCTSMGKAGTEADVAAIQEIWNTYSSARIAGDTQRWLALWDESGIQMPPDIPARGKDVLNEVIPKAFASVKVDTMNIYTEEITVVGSWAFSRGTYDSTRTVEGKAVKVDGKFLTILKRQADGSWKIYRDCYNYILPPK